jgi:ABC-type cobalamin/Fe3+-siderophores transport system ATPase subunit
MSPESHMQLPAVAKQLDPGAVASRDAIAGDSIEETFISLENVTKTFATPRGAITVLSKISLQVKKGKRLCIVGPSGCGKTTILNLISGFLNPTSGSVKVGGRPVTGPVADGSAEFRIRSESTRGSPKGMGGPDRRVLEASWSTRVCESLSQATFGRNEEKSRHRQSLCQQARHSANG